MAELCAPIPDVSVTSKSVQIEDLEFSSDHRINHGHEGVGSGNVLIKDKAIFNIKYSKTKELIKTNILVQI